MKIPYYTDYKTRQLAKKFNTAPTGGIAVTFFGIILYELAFTPKTLILIK